MRLLHMLLLVMLVAGACSTQRTAVQESRFQKRVHQSGWHVDFHGNRRDQVRAERAERRMPVREAIVASALPEPEERLTASVSEIYAPSAEPCYAQDRIVITAYNLLPVRSSPPGDSVYQDDENLMPRKKWNALAVPAFVAGLGTVALGFGTSIWWLTAGILITLVLAGLSMRGIRRREQAGKGFAFGALMIGVIAALLTAISIAWYGIDQ